MEQTTYLEKDRYKNQAPKKGADNFASNNNNPFLVSPYSPVNLGAFATNNFVNDISTVVSTLFGNLASVLDVTTYTLSISTIKSMPSDQFQKITMNMSTFVVTATTEINFNTPSLNLSRDLYVPRNLVAQNLFFSTATGSTISTFTSNTSGQLTAQDMAFITMSGNYINVSTISPSTISSNTLYVNASTIISISTPMINVSHDMYVANNLVAQNLFFSTATGSTISTFTSNTSGQLTAVDMGFMNMSGSNLKTSTLIVYSTGTLSTTSTNSISTSVIQFSTMVGNAITASTITVNSTTTTSSMNTNAISTSVIQFSTMVGNAITASTITASTLFGSSFTVSTLFGSNTTASSLIASSFTTSSMFGSILTASSITASSLFGSSIIGSSMITSTINTNQITVTSLTFDTMSIGTPLGSTFSGKYLTINISGAGANNGLYKIPLYN